MTKVITTIALTVIVTLLLTVVYANFRNPFTEIRYVAKESFAKRQIADFKADLLKSDRVTLEDWQNRPVAEKIAAKLSKFLNSQL